MSLTLTLSEKETREALAAYFGNQYGVRIEPNAIRFKVREANHSADQRENCSAGLESVTIDMPPAFGKKPSLPNHPDSFTEGR